MIPLIHKLLRSNTEVILASGGKAGELLRTEFPNQSFLDIPSFPMRYSRKGSQVFIMMIQIPAIIAGILKEHRWLKKTISRHQIDIVISDNRYGLYHKKILSVFVSHQVSPLLPNGLKWMEPFVFRWLGGFIRRFDRCWIPDNEDPSENLTGRLSHRYPAFRNTVFMGILSRFNELPAAIKEGKAEIYDVLVILSGPEPQRTLLEENLVSQLGKTDYKAAIICGLQQPTPQNPDCSSSSVTFFYHLPASLFRDLLLRAGIIICRAGYSTIMDLVELGRPAILIPTPGQPEQEYLAGYLKGKGWFHTAKQNDFDLKKEMQEFQRQIFTQQDHFRTEAEKYLQDLLQLYEHKKQDRD
jgi:hypothetical protein